MTFFYWENKIPLFENILGNVLYFSWKRSSIIKKENIIFSFMIFFYGKIKSPFREHSSRMFSTFLEKSPPLSKREYYDILYWENKIPLFENIPPEKNKIPPPSGSRRTPKKFFFGALRAPMPIHKTHNIFFIITPV